MDYLLVDAHQRFLGTMKFEQTLAIGDVFQAENSKTYAIVGINLLARQSHTKLPSLTVIPVNRRIEVPAS